MRGIETIEAVGEGAVSGNQASIPAVIREQADIDDGDGLRWFLADDELTVQVVRRRRAVFEGFEGFEPTGDPVDLDRVGVEPAGDIDAGEPVD